MIRILYRCLVWLHPPVFRREFAGEMLWIYDEAAQTEGAGALLVDGFVSLARQWFLRSGCWRLIAALAGAMFQVTIGGALMVRVGRDTVESAVVPTANPELEGLIRLVALTAVGLLAAVLLLVLWWRGLARRTGV
jgi:hypothetical protein